MNLNLFAWLSTNHSEVVFYGKYGFITTKEFSFPNPDTVSGSVTVWKMCKYLGEKIVRNVAIVGGTHGNERVGVELVEQWTADPSLIKRPTLTGLAVLGNPAAVDANVRFLDEDLNRLFGGDSISTADHIEGKRVKELNAQLDPKLLNYTEPTGSDFIIDLHSSNSRVGIVAMISSSPDDLTAVRLCHHLKTIFPELRVTTSPGRKHDSYSVDSIAPSGIAFEVGPLVHGTLSSPMLEATRQLVLSTLDFLDKRNVELLEESERSAAAAKESAASIDNYGASEFDSNTVNVVSSALAPQSLVPSAFPDLEQFMYTAAINYPEISTTNGVKYILHPSVEGNDWKPLLEGSPLFIAANGCGRCQ
eukprot:gene27937-34723_t